MEVAMPLSPQARTWALLAASLGLFQAVCWGIMALLAVIGHGDCELWDDGSVFLTAMQAMYFRSRDCPQPPSVPQPPVWSDSIMTPGAILAWMIILLSINCAWFFASLALLAAWRNKKLTFVCSITTIWCVVTSVVVIVDLVACAMFGADYGKIITTDSVASSAFLSPPAVIMTLAARGFVLWVINLGLLTYLVRALPVIHQYRKDLKEMEKRQAQADYYGPPAPGFEFYNQGFSMNEGQAGSSNIPPRGYHMYPAAGNQRHLPRPDYSPQAARKGLSGMARAQSRNTPRGLAQKQTGF